jgi:hypothetical protein
MGLPPVTSALLIMLSIVNSGCLGGISELNSLAISTLGVRSRKLSNASRSQSSGDHHLYLEVLRASESTLIPAAFVVVRAYSIPKEG